VEILTYTTSREILSQTDVIPDGTEHYDNHIHWLFHLLLTIHSMHSGLFQVRRRLPERMDKGDLPVEEHRAALASLARLNWFSRSSQILAGPLSKLLRTKRDSPWRVVDLASGGGDVLLALAQRFQNANASVEWIGIDVSEVAIDHAREQAQRRNLPATFIRGDVLSDPWPEHCDVVMCSLFLHHLDEAQSLSLLTRMRGEAGQLVLVNDLRRSFWGYWLAQAACRILSRSSVVHYDGPVSVAGAYTLDEVRQLAEQAGLVSARIEARWPQRFLLSWQRR
jgi:SAM-dependent methyltransferase